MRQLKKIYYLLDSIHQKKIPVFIFLTLIGTFLEILSTLLSRKVSKNAFKFRFTLKRVFDRFKQKGHKKN